MEAYFDQAWVLLGVGMLTVFAVLLFVVLIGNGIILFVNRFIPNSGVQESRGTSTGGTNASKVAAIVAAVKHVTGGRGSVVEIRKKE
ncbi:OadG family protein [Anaerophaga thermohalophila]|jgi:oxaloacetate decarboxylase gamma subunit|uniref:OadG family protein n=1 Tax=Anaerophaga thermohalophila TaxID=177400 RepID=UPI0002E6420A|nr:OadG family protein [Anaerophaga thermohalophila]